MGSSRHITHAGMFVVGTQGPDSHVYYKTGARLDMNITGVSVKQVTIRPVKYSQNYILIGKRADVSLKGVKGLF